MTKRNKTIHEPLIHLTRRLYTAPKLAWGIRIGAFVLSILACAIISTLLTPLIQFDSYFKHFFEGAFGTSQNVWVLFRDMAVLLLLALAVTPCFQMRYWNIGGEGQALMGGMGAAVIVNQLYGKMPVAALILLALAVAVAFAVVWAVIPAIFKALWNTNETLLTLMFNYIAGCLGAYFVKAASPRGTGSLSFLFTVGDVGKIGGNEYLSIILIAVAVMAFLFVYMRYTKHGYEVTVVGESPNTARYIGINNKKVIIRTLVLCGILCGIAGFMLVCFKDHAFKAESATQTTVAGLGFTAVLVSWLAHFNPFAMALTAFLVVFINRGSSSVETIGRLGDNYSAIMVGVFFFFIIATEFFINFKISFNFKHAKSKDTTAPTPPAPPLEAPEKVEDNTQQSSDNVSAVTSPETVA